MPARKHPLVTGQYYHVFNRGIDKRITYTSAVDYRRSLMALNYYRYIGHSICLSDFLKKSQTDQSDYFCTIQNSCDQAVEILAYCLMPNHFHLLLKQKTEGGISFFLKQYQGSYTKYFNDKEDRDGPLFTTQFKAVHIDSEMQLRHVSRYIHLNPYTGFICQNIADIQQYQWSSMRDHISPYLDSTTLPVSTEYVLSYYKNTADYVHYVEDYADYQRILHGLKQLWIEE